MKTQNQSIYIQNMYILYISVAEYTLFYPETRRIKSLNQSNTDPRHPNLNIEYILAEPELQQS